MSLNNNTYALYVTQIRLSDVFRKNFKTLLHMKVVYSREVINSIKLQFNSNSIIRETGNRN